MPLKLILVGCGKMGRAMFESWTAHKVYQDCYVIDPGYEDGLKDPDSLPDDFKPDVVVFAIKPQTIKSVLSTYQRFIPDAPLFLSIAAGIDIKFIAQALSSNAAIVRAMPNTPAAIGKGITVACANNQVSDSQKSYAETLLGALGALRWIDDEEIMNTVTAISGSGPAYVFYLIEALAQAAMSEGLPEDLAMTLARQTVIGSALLAEHEKNTPVHVLRENVTSPGGTTEAALRVLMPELKKLILSAVQAARRRGEEMS